ncbi:MAG TPA: ABC transporter substrate-binding protein, partial [Thermomicrobiales bacterium]
MIVQHTSPDTTRLNRRRFLTLASGATVSAILAACGGSSPTATTAAPTKAAASSAAATTAPVPAATTAPTTAAASAATSNATTAASGSVAAPTRAASSAVSTTASSSVAAATTSGSAQKVSVMLDWVPNTNHTGLYVAQERGYFKDQGLTVEIVPLAEGSSVEEVVAASTVQFGISASEPLSKARSEGIP